MKELPLVQLNDFAKAYAGITFQNGALRVATELNPTDGDFDGTSSWLRAHVNRQPAARRG
ncbi:MAG TPA: hypothetical protein VGF73_03525 [Chthoniobacterales bacterium]